MIKITFNLNDPEGTRKVEQINDEAESLDVYCEILLDGFEDWVKGANGCTSHCWLRQ